MSALAVKNLRKSFYAGFIPRRFEVLKGLSFTIEPGTITGFLGANGSGKTTTLKCILGLVFADSGEVSFFGGEPLSSAVKSRIGFLPEHPYFYDYLTGAEFLRFYGEISTELSSWDLRVKIGQTLERVGLTHAADRKLRNYSKGMLQKIGVAQALIHSPELVILDEPMSGLDPDGRYQIGEIIRDVVKNGASVFFSSHLLHDAERLCERLVILKGGMTCFEGKTDELLSDLAPGYEISYLHDDKMEKTRVATLPEIQQQLDALRTKNASILEVRQLKPHLEEVFVNLAFEKDGERI